MASPTHFKCECQHCGGHLECPVESASLTTDCPHCGKQTELIAPSQKSSGSARKFVFIGFALVLLVATGSIWLVKKSAEKKQLRLAAEAEAARFAVRQAAEAEARANDPVAQAGWNIAAVTFEKTPGSTVIHAIGDLQNETDRRRFGVKVHLDLVDANGQKIGAATDYQASIEPRARWRFSALVVNAKAVTAKVTAVDESP